MPESMIENCYFCKKPIDSGYTYHWGNPCHIACSIPAVAASQTSDIAEIVRQLRHHEHNAGVFSEPSFLSTMAGQVECAGMCMKLEKLLPKAADALEALAAIQPADPGINAGCCQRVVVAEQETFYIDCEFDGHGGPLLSIAMVQGKGRSMHVHVQIEATDPWVIANVMPAMNKHSADLKCTVHPDDVGVTLLAFIGDCQRPHIVADSPVDIGRFCRAISTGPDGKWASVDYSQMTFAVHNIDCYPTTLEFAVQHNAWWDAMALRAAIDVQPDPRDAQIARLVDAAEAVYNECYGSPFGHLIRTSHRLRAAIAAAKGGDA